MQCVVKDEMPFCVASDAKSYLGHGTIWRENEDIVQKAVFLVDPSMRALQASVLVGWNVYAARGRRSQDVHLQVWRPISVAHRRYVLAGETQITAEWVGYSFFPLRPEDRINVLPGDILGLYFPSFNPIPWSSVECHDGNEHLFKYNPTRLLSSGGTITFDQPARDWKPCRHYSFNGTLMSNEGQSKVNNRQVFSAWMQ